MVERIVVATLLIVLPIAFWGIVMYRRSKDKRLIKDILKEVKPAYNKLKRNEPLTRSEILPHAENVLTRDLIFQLLRNFDKQDLFPQEYYTLENASESYLARWMKHVSDYKKCPDEICLLKKVPIENVYYYVYKYRFKEWTDAEGWEYGVVGAYTDSSKPYDEPESTFSRSRKVDEISPEEEALWVHTEIGL